MSLACAVDQQTFPEGVGGIGIHGSDLVLLAYKIYFLGLGVCNVGWYHRSRLG